MSEMLCGSCDVLKHKPAAFTPITTQARKKQAEATIEIQTCLGSYQELRGNTDPELTFICLERNAARIKACLLSNKKSSCCWAARVIVKEVLMLILCLVLYAYIGSMPFMHQMHQTPVFITLLTVGLNKD